jgi:hypothetical protein
MENKRIAQMKAFLSVLLVADKNTTLGDLSNINAAAATGKGHASDHDVMVVCNGCREEVWKSISTMIGRMENSKMLRLAGEVEPDVAIFEGLQRSIGDYVLVGSVQDVSLLLASDMLDRAQEGHEVVIAQPRIGATLASVESMDYGTRILSRAAVHYVLNSGASRKGAYHLLARHQLFNPIFVEYSAGGAPVENILRGLRRRWHAMISSRVTPLRVVSGMALFGAGANILYSLYVIIIFMIQDQLAPGWATLSLQASGMFFLFSLVLFMFSEYLIGMIRAAQINQGAHVISEIRSRTVTYDRANLESV